MYVCVYDIYIYSIVQYMYIFLIHAVSYKYVFQYHFTNIIAKVLNEILISCLFYNKYVDS